MIARPAELAQVAADLLLGPASGPVAKLRG